MIYLQIKTQKKEANAKKPITFSQGILSAVPSKRLDVKTRLDPIGTPYEVDRIVRMIPTIQYEDTDLVCVVCDLLKENLA